MNEVIAGEAPKEYPFARLQRILKDITYKPGSTLNASVHECGLVTVVHTREVPSVDNPRYSTTICLSRQIGLWELDNMPDDVIVDSFIRHILVEVETHEINEWFKYKGKNVRDPHP